MLLLDVEMGDPPAFDARCMTAVSIPSDNGPSPFATLATAALRKALLESRPLYGAFNKCSSHHRENEPDDKDKRHNGKMR
ncbi:MAG TPA: hypothetical protein VIS99_17045 [Terrimicrobiaceae bacterium]